jgi:hypothetical protein
LGVISDRALGKTSDAGETLERVNTKCRASINTLFFDGNGKGIAGGDFENAHKSAKKSFDVPQ